MNRDWRTMTVLARWLAGSAIAMVTTTAQAALIDLRIDGNMTSRSGGSSYGGGYNVLDQFQPGQSLQINLIIDYGQLSGTGTAGEFHFAELGTGAVVVDNRMRLGSITNPFSLLSSSGYPSRVGECFEAPDCYDDFPDPGPVVPIPVHRDSETLSMEQTSQLAFSWKYLATELTTQPDDYPYAPVVDRSQLAFSLQDISQLSFDEVAAGRATYSGIAGDSGSVSVFSDFLGGEGYGLWEFAYQFDITGISLAPVSPVPEAETWAMMTLGAALLGWRLRRRHQI